MNLRDWFAGQALIGILGARNGFLVDVGIDNAPEWAYRVADAMIATSVTSKPEQPPLSWPINRLKLSVRSRRTLERMNISTVSELVRVSEAVLLTQRNTGAVSVNEIAERLASHGIEWVARKDEWGAY